MRWGEVGNQDPHGGKIQFEVLVGHSQRDPEKVIESELREKVRTECP